jgi:Fungal specific transcription factor domain
VKTAKEELVRKIKALETKNAQLRGSVEEKDRWIGRVLQILRDEQALTVLEQLKQGQPYHELLSALSRAPVLTKLDSADSTDSSRGLSDANMAATDGDQGLSRWTSVTTDETLVHHLMALYFAWVHPMYMLFSERHFMSSFNGGTSRYCTSAMVNAMCALGCAYWADPEGGRAESKMLLGQFYQRARIEVESEESMSPATPVTYTILFLVEMSRGEARSAASHLRLAVEALRIVNRRSWAEEPSEITIWGIHTLNTSVQSQSEMANAF